MKWLDTEIIIDTISINVAALLFSILSLTFSIITILIYLRVKSLRTIIYKIFFLLAINETISRIAHIFQFINEYFNIKNLTIFEINISLIYLTDNNILIFLAYSCYSMVELILRQNKNINNQFKKISLFILIFSIILTTIFSFISIKVENNRDISLYRNVLAFNFILDTDEEGRQLSPILITSIIYILLTIYSFYKIILIQFFIKNRGSINERDEDEDENQKEEKMQKSLKLQSFKNKMWQYPILCLYFIFPLLLYSYFEYFKNIHKVIYLKRRYYFYNIYCFLNSTRGWMSFRVFISNEKIKIYLFKNYLTSNIFYSIDKINLKRERQFTKSSLGSLNLNSSILSNDDKIINSEGNEMKEEEEKLLNLKEN